MLRIIAIALLPTIASGQQTTEEDCDAIEAFSIAEICKCALIGTDSLARLQCFDDVALRLELEWLVSRATAERLSRRIRGVEAMQAVIDAQE